MGIDTGVMFSYLRGLLFSQGFTPWEMKIGTGMHRIFRAQMDVSTEDWVETCEWMADEQQDEWPGLEIPVDKVDAEVPSPFAGILVAGFVLLLFALGGVAAVAAADQSQDLAGGADLDLHDPDRRGDRRDCGKWWHRRSGGAGRGPGSGRRSGSRPG